MTLWPTGMCRMIDCADNRQTVVELDGTRVTWTYDKKYELLSEHRDDPEAAAKALAAIVIEPARAETEGALQKRFEGDERRMHLGRAIAILTPAQVEEIESRINDLIADCIAGDPDLDDPNARGYAFTYTLVATDAE